MADYTLKRYDTGPAITATILDAFGNTVNLTGASVNFVMRPMTAVAPTTNLAATIVSAPAGTVSYTPTSTDTGIAGIYQAEFHITSSGGVKTTFPTAGYLEIQIEEDLITPGGSRIVGVGEAKAYLGFQDSDKSRDAKLLRFIDAMTPVVEGITGPIVQRTIQNELHDGGGRQFLSLRNRPVITVSAVTEYRGPIAYPLTQIATPDLGTIYSYMWETNGRITRRTVGGGTTPFPPGIDSVYVTYSTGYIVPPANVVEGVLELIRINFQETQQGRPKVGSLDGGDMAREPFLGFFVPGRVRELLAPNKRHPRIA